MSDLSYIKFFTPIGEMLLASEGSSLCGAWFMGQKYFPAMEGWGMEGWEERENELFDTATFELARYFMGQLQRFTVSLRPRGTPFQQKVWSSIAEIPYGRAASYEELAKRLGSSPRAVGAATGRNPLSIFIPCHRVVGSGGDLTGYAGGLKKKEALLKLEGVEVKDGKALN
ncbi:MAG: methylated-DNA--[protein]-cysteine S-methyltransferase [Synergistaceae bacterium]|jgi:methylated-DNA-[protein]-cysteine S-methyltransferase|nr:methylated-DNA--[protein]-cysteine S-methyltransferase [Synergistaceae bacterium]